MKHLILALVLAVSSATADDLLLGVRASTGAKQKTLAIASNRILIFDASAEPVFLAYPAFLDAIGAVSVSRQISTGAGLAGGGDLSANRTLALTGQALAFHNLASSGIVVRTGADAVTARTIVSVGEGIAVTNGNGVNANPTISLADDVAALEALLSTGFAVRTGSNAWSLRTMTASGSGLAITNGSGVSGNPVFALADDVAAVEALASTGFPVRTGSNAWAQRSIAVAAGGKITVANADGVSGNPTLDVADGSTSQKGAVAIASNGEVQTGTDTAKAVVSSALAAWFTWIKTQAQTIAGAWTFSGNLVTNGNFTGGDASGDSATLNWGTVTAPNIPGITQRGYTTTLPDASGRLISAGNTVDFAPAAQPISLSVAQTYRSLNVFNANGVTLSTNASFAAVGGGPSFQCYTTSSGADLGDMAWAYFGDATTTFQAGGAFPTSRKMIFTGKLFLNPSDAPNNNGKLIFWVGNPPRSGVGISSITRSGTTATVTSNGHLLAAGAWVRITGATEAGYNGYFQISNVTTNTFDVTVSGSPSTPATGSPAWACQTIGGFGITIDAAGLRLAGVTSSGSYTETSTATGLSSVVNGNFASRYFWLCWNADGTAALYLADQATSATTPPPVRPASSSLTLSGLGGSSYRVAGISLSWVGTGATPTNSASWGLANLWVHLP